MGILSFLGKGNKLPQGGGNPEVPSSSAPLPNALGGPETLPKSTNPLMPVPGAAAESQITTETPKPAASAIPSSSDLNTSDPWNAATVERDVLKGNRTPSMGSLGGVTPPTEAVTALEKPAETSSLGGFGSSEASSGSSSVTPTAEAPTPLTDSKVPTTDIGVTEGHNDSPTTDGLEGVSTAQPEGASTAGFGQNAAEVPAPVEAVAAVDETAPAAVAADVSPSPAEVTEPVASPIVDAPYATSGTVASDAISSPTNLGNESGPEEDRTPIPTTLPNSAPEKPIAPPSGSVLDQASEVANNAPGNVLDQAREVVNNAPDEIPVTPASVNSTDTSGSGSENSSGTPPVPVAA